MKTINRKLTLGKIIFLNPILLALALVTTPVFAHEFWISLENGTLKPGDTIVGDLKVGIMLKGEPYPFLSNRFKNFNVNNSDLSDKVFGNEGDLPALKYVAKQPGLYVISQETTAFRVTYKDWDLFRRYLTEEGLDEFADLHQQRGLPETGFTERYTRCIKALVQVGSVKSTQADVEIGMPIELLAETNPYVEGADQLTVKLLWEGLPLRHWQINIFHDTDKSDTTETVERSKVMTDEQGRAVIPLAGSGEYLLNAVHLQAVDDTPVVWQSHWGTLSFKL